jgi:hypothetical protein
MRKNKTLKQAPPPFMRPQIDVAEFNFTNKYKDSESAAEEID